MSPTPIETERKFLIAMPDTAALHEIDRVKIKNIEQTYLLEKGARVRRIVEDGRTYFIKTVKERISTLSCFENEFEIDAQTYECELKKADITRQTIKKTRYAFPFCAHVIEIDVYPFWSDRAILEVELASESESFELPEFIKIIKEVSADPRYKNTSLAIEVPYDEL